MLIVDSIDAATVSTIHLWVLGTGLVPLTTRRDSMQSASVLVDVVRKLSPAIAQMAHQQKHAQDVGRSVAQVLGGNEFFDPIVMLQMCTPPNQACVAAAWRRVFVFALKCDGQQQNLHAINAICDQLQELLIIIHKMAIEELSRCDYPVSGQTTPRSNAGSELDSFRTPPSSPGPWTGLNAQLDSMRSGLLAQLEESESKNAVLMRNLEKTLENADELKKKDDDLNAISKHMQRVLQENEDLKQKIADQENKGLKTSSQERFVASQNNQEVATSYQWLKEPQQENEEFRQLVSRGSETDSRSLPRAPLRTVNCESSPQQQPGADVHSKLQILEETTGTGAKEVGTTSKEVGTTSNEASTTSNETYTQNFKFGSSLQDSSGYPSFPEKAHSEGSDSPPESPRCEATNRRSSTGSAVVKERKRRNSGGKQRRPRAIASQGKVHKVPEPGQQNDCKQQ